MDGVVSLCDDLFFDRVYSYLLPHPPVPSSLKPLLNSTYSSAYSTSPTYTPSPSASSLWARDYIPRQCTSILLIAGLGAAALYFVFCAASYYLLYDRRLEHHPRFLKNQVRQEIASSLWAIPTIDVLTLPFFLAEVRGHSLLYTDINQYGYAWLAISTVLYLFWNDFGIYWIHRLEHHPRIYKYIHKPHHKWIGESGDGCRLGVSSSRRLRRSALADLHVQSPPRGQPSRSTR
jgi:lathosterol oxidase